MEETLIDFDEIKSNDSKETIWTIENNEKMQLASFIEQQILTKMQYLFYEKDKQIRELRMTNAYLHTEIDDFKDKLSILENLIYEGFTDIKDNLQIVTDDVATVTEDLATVTEDVATVTEDLANVINDVAKHTNYLSNSYINLYPKELNPQQNNWIFKTDIKELTITGYVGTKNIEIILWDLIGNFSQLNKLSMAIAYTANSSGISLFTKFKSKTIRELVLLDGTNVNSNVFYIYDYIQDILTNIPNLQILDITCSDGRDPTWMNKFVEKISSIVHKLQKIKLTRGGIVSIHLTRIQQYCKINNIVLEIA